jgi:hypothetical protein
MQLTERELAEISKRLADAEAMLAVLPQTASETTAELGLVVIRGALLALDESAVDATHAARTLQKLRLTLSTLNVPSKIHEHVCEAFRVLGKGHDAALRQVEAACLVDARYRQQSLRAELQGVLAELAGDDPAAALEPARRAQTIVDALATPGLRQIVGAKSPQEAIAELVRTLGG